jgi:hypothetical protein
MTRLIIKEKAKTIGFMHSSSSRSVFPSDLHSYSKRRFIRPFAPPCYPLSPAKGCGESQGGAGGMLGESCQGVGGGVVRNFLIIVLYKH